jgi:NADH dehydrogenase
MVTHILHRLFSAFGRVIIFGCACIVYYICHTPDKEERQFNMILVTGAVGFVGRYVVRQLMAEGLPVRCLLPEYQSRRLPWHDEPGGVPEIVVGTLLDDEAVFKAVTGVHTIIHLASAQWWGRQRDLERVEIAGTRNLIAIARSARVGRIITLSHLGAASSSAYLLHRIKGQVEELVRNSGLAYTILRTGIIFGEDDVFINHIAMMLRMNPFFFLMPGQGEIVLHPIYIDDLVKAIGRSLESIDAIDKTLEIGGLEYVTLEDLLFTVMRVTGMQRFIIPVPPYLLRWITIVYDRLLPRTLMTPQWLDILATNRTAGLGNMYDYFRFQPRRFEDTLLTYLPRQRHFWRVLRHTFRRRPRGL